ncbi:MAG: hypothetical protein RR495_01510 [Anaerovoracaceae bacterium]
MKKLTLKKTAVIAGALTIILAFSVTANAVSLKNQAPKAGNESYATEVRIEDENGVDISPIASADKEDYAVLDQSTYGKDEVRQNPEDIKAWANELTGLSEAEKAELVKLYIAIDELSFESYKLSKEAKQAADEKSAELYARIEKIESKITNK